MDTGRFERSIEKILENSVYIGNKDDLYNLSVRKKASSLCCAILHNLDVAESCYGQIADGQTAVFIQENGQVKKICSAIYNMVRVKETETPDDEKIPGGERLYHYTSRILIKILDAVLDLAQLINIRHIERELIFISNLLTKQLIYIFPRG